jgi:branched-chain amino acid transport system substrate-binding protein
MRERIGSGLARLAMATAVCAGVVLGAMSTGLTETSAEAATLQPIVVGDICSCTGPEQASLSQTTPTLQAWASYVNAHGGIAGHKVKLVVKDDGYNPSTSLSAVKEMVQSNHVAVLVDNSDVDNAWGAFVEQNSIPVVGGQISNLGYSNPMFFVPSATYNYLPDGMAAVAKSVGLKKLANLYCAEVVACSQSSSGLKTAASKIGLSVSYATSISFSAPNYTAQCLASQQSGADAMVVGDATPIVSKIAQECASQGYKPIEVSADGTVATSSSTTR